MQLHRADALWTLQLGNRPCSGVVYHAWPKRSTDLTRCLETRPYTGNTLATFAKTYVANVASYASQPRSHNVHYSKDAEEIRLQLWVAKPDQRQRGLLSGLNPSSSCLDDHIVILTREAYDLPCGQRDDRHTSILPNVFLRASRRLRRNGMLATVPMPKSVQVMSPSILENLVTRARDFDTISALLSTSGYYHQMAALKASISGSSLGPWSWENGPE